MPCRIGINLECCTAIFDLYQRKSLTFHIMSDAFLIIVVGSTKVGFIPALVRHEEVEIWAEAEEVEEKTQDLDDWEIAERKAARQAKIVAVPLG